MKRHKFMFWGLISLLLLGIAGCGARQGFPESKIAQEVQVALKQTNNHVDVQLEMINNEIKQQKNYIDVELGLVKKEMHLNSDIVRDCCRSYFEFNNIDVLIQQQYDIQVKPFLIKIPVIEEQLEQLNKSYRDKELKNVEPDNTTFYKLIGWSTTAVIGLAGLNLVWGVYRSLVDSQRIFIQTKQKLDKTFIPWLTERENEYTTKIEDLTKKYEVEISQYIYFLRLKLLISAIPNPTAKDIYPLLTPLTSNPRLEYEALFDKIKEMYISKEINAKIEGGLKKLRDRRSK